MSLEKNKAQTTKSKILEVAEEQFAVLGFNGTSVRSIAKESGVNLAAISYHFGSKSELYWEVIQASHEWGVDTMAQLALKAQDTEDLAVKFFLEANKNIKKSRNILRLMLTVGVPMTEKFESFHYKKMLEIPILKIFGDVIEKEIAPRKVKEEEVFFVAQVVFSNIIVSIMNRASFKVLDNKRTPKHLSVSFLESNIRKHTQILVTSLKSN